MRSATAGQGAIRLLLGIMFLLPTAILAGQDLPLLDYRTDSWFLPQTPGVTAGPVGGLFNPAAFGLTARAGSDLWFRHDETTGEDQYGFAMGRTLNFAYLSSGFNSGRIDDYQLGLAKGGRAGSFGLAYRWATGGNGPDRHQSSLVMGNVVRNRWLSFGSATTISLESDNAQHVFDLGLRPFGRSWCTLYGDWTANQGEKFFQDGTWGAGLTLRPWRGVRIGARARQRTDGDVDYAATVGVILGRTGIWGLPGFDADGHGLGTAWLLRTDPPRTGLDPRELHLAKGPRYRTLNLENKYLTYQKYRLFDERHLPWLDLLPRLQAMRDDPHLDIVAVNMAGFSGRPSLLWELREMLLQIKQAGKTVVIQADRLNAGTLYVASVADRLSLDPQGQIVIPGVALARSYLKGTLEKLGLGFQAHRYLKYKSAAETLSRDSMSAADREQRQRIVDVAYTVWRQGIASGRDLRDDAYDELVDENGWLPANEALAAGLVDTLGRWDGLIDWLGKVRRARPASTSAPLPTSLCWDEQWGQPPRIPVVYAVGNCAMDEGIKGRSTSAYLRGLVHDPTIKAVVLRVDSPGGDPLPSDLVAQAVSDLRQAGKPVVISQGDVAASGGYWLSMNGTEIMTTPLTITGSIGVISGWLWDDGFAKKLGVTSDAVQRGAHADLFTTVNIPVIGGIPRRPMNDDEMARSHRLIMGMYHDFVAKVAAGRGLEEAAVDSVAQGRVWMGQDAIDHGLCDKVGGLADAIDTARRLAGIPSWQESQVVEYPPRPLIRLPQLLPDIPSLLGLGNVVAGWFGAGPAATPTTPADLLASPAPASLPLPALQRDFLRQVAAALGQPLVVMDPDLLPAMWQDPE